MKKTICVLLCLASVLFFAGCGSTEVVSKTVNRPAGVAEVLEERTAGAEESVETNDPQRTEKPKNTDTAEESVDVDLTALSGTMVYSEVYNMTTSPETYIGKSVKMKGPFSVYHDEAADRYYFACVIQDATACCAQGIEFVLADGGIYPDDYPALGEEICVIGVFDTYQEGEYTYCTLRNAKIL